MADPTQLDPFDWERAFFEYVANDSTAQRAWGKLKNAGLDDIAKVILFQAVRYSDGPTLEIQRGSAQIINTLKSARRARDEAEKRSGDARAEMFGRRRTEAAERAARSPWPFGNRDVKTLYDAASTYSEIGDQTLHRAPHSVAKAADGFRRWGLRKHMLAILKVGAENRGVILSPRDLAALAWCADTNWDVDERSLRRSFRESWLKAAKRGYIANFDSLLDQLRISN